MSPSPAVSLTGQCHTLSQFQVLTSPTGLHQCYTHRTCRSACMDSPRTWAACRPHTILWGVWEEEYVTKATQAARLLMTGFQQCMDAAPRNAEWIRIGRAEIPMYRFSQWIPMLPMFDMRCIRRSFSSLYTLV